MNTTQPYGTVSKESDGTYTLRYERHFAHPMSRVWQAITDPAKVAMWFGILREPLTEGNALYMKFTHAENARIEGTVKKVQPENLLEYTWVSRGEPMNIRWELQDEGDGKTRLILTHTKLQQQGDVKGYGGGWHAHLRLLEEVVDGVRTEFAMDMAVPKSLEPHYAQVAEEVA